MVIAALAAIKQDEIPAIEAQLTADGFFTLSLGGKSDAAPAPPTPAAPAASKAPVEAEETTPTLASASVRRALDAWFADNSYVEGTAPSQSDVSLYSFIAR